MQWIYLSPHLDDAALSCGGLIWEQVHAGDQVAIWTICAGLIPGEPLSPFAQELHLRWKTGPEAVVLRRIEDKKASERLGAATRYFDLPDCIYRFRHLSGEVQPVIRGESDLQEAEPESDLIVTLSQILKESYPSEANIVCPMALGDHIDHRLTRSAAERCNRSYYYYPDYPYILRSEGELEKMENGLWKRYSQPISMAGLTAWQEAIAEYPSQISTFWTGLEEVNLAIKNYWGGGGGRVWKSSQPV